MHICTHYENARILFSSSLDFQEALLRNVDEKNRKIFPDLIQPLTRQVKSLKLRRWQTTYNFIFELISPYGRRIQLHEYMV